MNLSHQTRIVSVLLLVFLGIQGWRAGHVSAQSTDAQERARTAVSNLLDKYGKASADADAETFFNCLDKNGIFFGTDEKERFTYEQFRTAFMPYFEQGISWKRNVLDRKIHVGPGADVCWFEERSLRKDIGPLRTTGVVTKQGDEWKITQFNTSLPIPNEVIQKVADLISEFKSSQKSDEDTSPDKSPLTP